MRILSIFSAVAIAEGISYLLLLFIAMPLKYFADMPLAVKYTGWAHGVLFVLYIGVFLLAWRKAKWKFGVATVIGGAALLPFAPFYVENRYIKGTATNANKMK